MSLEESIRETCLHLTSTRATERKKYADKLKDYLNRNAVPSLLTHNTLKKTGYTWNHVFDEINDYILKETEKYESSKKFFDETAPLCTSILHLSVAGSNKGRAYIKCEKITEACLNVLNDNRLTYAIGDAYLSLLYKHVLPNEDYLGHITPHTWENLLEVCITAFLSSTSRTGALDDFVKIRLLWYVIKNATRYCQFTIPLRDSLHKLKKCLLKENHDKKVQDIIVKIALLLLETLFLEFPLTTCEFSEGILPYMLKLYEQSMEQNKKGLLFKLFQVVITVHHPLGRIQISEGALASNWNTWNKQLSSILEIVCLEVNYIQKLRNQNKNIAQCDFFYNIAAFAYYQIFYMSKNSIDESVANGNSAKKQRLTFNKNKSFNDIVEEIRYNHIPWVGIVQKYVKNFDESISYIEYLALMRVLETLLSENQSNMCWENLEDLTCLVIRKLILKTNNHNQDNSQVVLSLWNTCARNAGIISAGQKTMLRILQVILNLIPVTYQNAQQLLVSYIEKGMPVNDQSLKMLNILYNKMYRKICNIDMRSKCFNWLLQGNIVDIDIKNLEDFLERLLCNEKMPLKNNCDSVRECDNLFDVVFKTTDKSLLYSKFEYKIKDELLDSKKHDNDNLEINLQMDTIILFYLEQELKKNIKHLTQEKTKVTEFAKNVHIVVTYFHILLKNGLKNENDIFDMSLYSLLIRALKQMYSALTHALKSDIQTREKVIMLKCIKNILLIEYFPVINAALREHIDENCFYAINDIIKLEITVDDGEPCYDDDLEFSLSGLKQNCILFLAAYCRKQSAFTDDILKCILDRDLYNFVNEWEIECALKCICLLNDNNVDQSPLEQTFSLMQGMCKELFRKPKATRGLLLVLVPWLERIWSHNDTVLRQNCVIMIKSYLQRCTKLFYPPDVAALIYECIAKIVQLSFKQDSDLANSFEHTLIEKAKGNCHSIRLYICHLMKYIVSKMKEKDFEELFDNLLEIFIIEVSENNESILKDESANRTATFLHCFYELGVAKQSFLHKIILKLLQLQSEKMIDKVMVKKVLNILIKNVIGTNIDEYMNNNMLRILYHWFKQNKSFENLPLYLLGFNDINTFVDNNLKWLMSSNILWQNNGLVESSDVLKYLKDRTGKTTDDFIEVCFCNIMTLCLPYIVVEKYKLNDKNFILQNSESAKRLFQQTRQILKNDKWSSIFGDSLGELVLLAAMHICDPAAASELFQIPVEYSSDSYTFSKQLFSAILKYFGEVIDGNIMQHLCNNEPLVVLNILFKLWNNVLHEKIFDNKLLSFHAYLTFIDSIPLGNASDAIFCNYICASTSYAIKESQTKKEVKMFVDGYKIIVNKIFNKTHHDIDNIQKSVLSEAISILTMKIEEGYYECKSLRQYLIENMKCYFSESRDVVDYIDLVVKDVDVSTKSSKLQFLEKLNTYSLSLLNPSCETLQKMFKFLKHNKYFVKDLYTEIAVKGFSEDCKTSLIHRIISALNYILKTSSNEKIIIEACNCLAEIGTYDIKTLVTMPPADTKQIVNLNPSQCFTIAALTALSEHIFDEDPAVSNKVAKSLSGLFKFRDSRTALDMADIDHKILKSLLSEDAEIFAEYKIDNVKFDLYNALEYWIPVKDENHFQWITRITMSVLDVITLDSNYIGSLRVVCAVKPSVCQKVMPALIGLFIYCANEIHINVLSEQINQFFKYIWDMSFEQNFENSEDCNGSKVSHKLDQDNKMVVRYLLDVVNFVRLQRNHYKSRKRGRICDDLNYLKLDYQKVSWAASVADQSLVAVYYGELWAAAQNRSIPPSSPQATAALPGGEHLLRIMRRCFISVGEIDAIDGCGTSHLTSEREKRKHLISTGQFNDALLLHDIALSRGMVDLDILYGAVTSLHKSGMHHLALQYIKSYPENDELDDVKYDCLSYLGDWSDFVDTAELEERSKNVCLKRDSVIKAMRYACLKECLTVQPKGECNLKLEKPLSKAKLAVARLCQNFNMENCQNVYKVVANLQLFRDIETYFSVKCGTKTITEVIDEWQVKNLPTFNDFKYIEPLISQRCLILEQAAKNNSMYLANINDLQIQYAELGLSNQRVQMAQRLVAAVKNDESTKKVALIESQISWAKGHKDIALSLLHDIVTQNSENVALTAMSLRQYGLWMAETKRENSRDIIHKYLEKSLQELKRSDDVETRLKVYYDIAKFADAEYKQVVTYMNSSVFEDKVKCMENMKGTAASLKSSQQSLTRDERKALITNNAFRELDEAEIANTREEKETFLKLAMRYYLLSLKQSDENNLSVFRVISLWFDNPEFDFEDEASGDLEEVLHTIPSWKFITVLPQIAPRLSNDKTRFAEILRKIIKRCAIEHPHHTLPILFNLKNSEKDQCILNASRGAGGVGGAGGAGAAARGDARVASAAALVAQLSSEHRALVDIIAQMEELCDAIISFAYYVPKAKDLKPQAIPRAEPISRLRDLSAIPIPTDTIAIKKDGDYSSLNTLSSFENFFELVGGINYPKKISCMSSDGKKRILLIKGEDDLRQDAVMQQVFNIVNTLLEKDPTTLRNKLLIRTYKVVPMSRRSGVLEWCVGTMPLGVYLVTAHTKHRPQDITPQAARIKCKECHDNRRSNKHKLDVFNEILKVFKPVFHYFFTEHYLDPVTWYERRLAYTRSVATSSMVGYIMGIGDRHVQNILIDKSTAEVIHIDFGIAFDQGKTLPTPETVPFRLTQDVIAGFGSSGVEGTFRRCCEKTLQLLRDNQEMLLTILEVLLCDPLYLWIISPTVKTKSSARSASGAGASGGGLAARALLGVRSKLCGGEGGARVSPAGQVARLLRDATDPANLARLFHGWQPYL